MEPHNRKILIKSLSRLLPAITTATPPSGQPNTLAPGTDPTTDVIAVVFACALLVFLLFFMIPCCLHLLGYPDNEIPDIPRSRHRSDRTTSSRASFLPSVANPSTGVDPMMIRALPVYPYSPNPIYQMVCAICLNEFKEKEAVKEIPFCKHVFHPECIDRWLSMHLTCPVCRSTQLLDLGVKEEISSDQGVSESGERSNHEIYIQVRMMRPVG